MGEERIKPSSYGIEVQEIMIKAIGRYLCSRACDYAGAEGMAHYTLDTKDLSDVFMIDEQWLEDRKSDIYNAAWHDPLFLRNIKPGEGSVPMIFAIDVVESFDEEAAEQIYVRMETFIDIWVRFVIHGDQEDLGKLLKYYKEPWIASSKHVPTDRVRHDLVCTLMARKILIVASDNSDEDSAQATIDIYPLLERPWEKDLIDEFDPGKESVVARRMRSDVFLSKYLLMYEVRDFNKERKTGWLDIQIDTDLASWGNGCPIEGEADCRYHDAKENYDRASRSFEMVDYTGTYEELLSILAYLQTPTAMVDIFNRADQETVRRKKHYTPKKIPAESGRYPWSKEETEELKRRIVSLDPVNHPVHYADACSLECIDVMQTMFDDEQFGGYLLCNAFKYLWRHKNKGGKEDLRKSKWYLDKFEEDYISYSGRLGVTYQRLRFLLNKIMSGKQ